MSTITGGGFFENIPRMLLDGQGVKIDTNSFPRPKVFDLLMKTGNIELKEMYNVFNMGIGFIMAVDKSEVEKTLAELNKVGQEAYVIGEVTNSGEVELVW
jgi:phosphoribosylformylglycinamidine cyclo-ligase